MKNIDKHSYEFIKDYSSDVIITIILNEFNESEKIDILRNKDFIDKTPNYILETILNNMQFVSVLNMLQNNTLLNKINNINVKLSSKDYIFIPDCLNQEELVSKINHQMLKNMLITLSKEEVIKYLNISYIKEELTIEDIIEIAISKKINLVKEYNIINKLTKEQVTEYINGMWSTNPIYSLIDNYHVKNILFNNNIDNIDEIIYLYELLNTKSNHNIKNVIHSVDSFKAVNNCYQLFGFDDTMTLLNKNNRSLNDITSTFKNININKVLTHKDLINFINKHYDDLLDNKYNNLTISFSIMINNYTKEFDNYDNLYELEKHLFKKYNINDNIPKDIIKQYFNNSNSDNLEVLVNNLNNDLDNINNRELIIQNIDTEYKDYKIQILHNSNELLLHPNIKNNEFIIKIINDNCTNIIDAKRDGNIIYLTDKSTLDISEIIKYISELLINNSKEDEYPINYVLINSKRNNKGIRISSIYTNNNDYNILVAFNKPLDINNINNNTTKSIKKSR